MTSVHTVPGLSFDEERLAKRRETLGASEISSVAGLNPHRTALDVWLEKKNMVPSFAGNAFTEWGLRLEGVIREKYEEVVGVSCVREDFRVPTLREEWMACTPDGLAIGGDGVITHGVEVKRFGDYRADEYGVPGTDQVPLDVATQCHWSMMVTGLKRWDNAVLLGQADFRIYTLEYNDAIANQLYDVGREFWFDHVQANVQPPIDGSASAKRFLNARFASHGPALVEATPELIDEARRLADLRDEQKHIEQQIAAAENRLKLATGENAGIRGICSWRAPKSGPVSWKGIAGALGASKPENAELIARFTSPGSRRFLFTYKEG